MTPSPVFFASASPGTERMLLEELREFGFPGTRHMSGGIPFEGSWQDAWYACLHSRIAQRIMAQMHRDDCADADAVYSLAAAVDWTPYIAPHTTVAVGAYLYNSSVDNSMFAALKVKDAIVDQVRSACGARPDVDREDADVRVFLHLVGGVGTLYLDLSGDPLFMRGYRGATGDAPLKETLAAALLRYSGWDRKSPLIDPMCGSGTIAVEAALWAANVAPGIQRERFGFERWANYTEDSRQVMKTMRGDARRHARGSSPRIVASDSDPAMVAIARAAARRAGVRLAFREADIRQLDPVPGRWIVTNPPYDVRLQVDEGFLQQVCAVLEQQHLCRIALIAGNPLIPKCMQLEPVRSYFARNGSLQCQFLVYDIP